MSWKWGRRPFSKTQCRKEICSTCLSQESMPFVKSKPPLPTRSLRFLRAAVRSCSALCIMVGSCSSLRCSSSQMQRSRGFGHGVVVSNNCYNKLIVLSVVLCDCCKSTNNCRDSAFGNSGLETGLPAFQLPMFTKCHVLYCRKEICSTCLLKESIPAILCCKDIQLMESQSSSNVRVDV